MSEDGCRLWGCTGGRSIATTLLLETFKPDVALHKYGICRWGFLRVAEVGTVVISEEVRHHDVDVTAFGYEHGQVPGQPVRTKRDGKLLKLLPGSGRNRSTCACN